MTDQAKQKLKYWIIGLFTGAGVAAPITSFITKRVYEKKMEENVSASYNDGLNDMAAYAKEQQAKEMQQQYEEPKEEDINNYDLSIDDDAATEEAKERTEAHERYLDMIQKYTGDMEIKPYIINEEQFINEQYMLKSFVNWYEDDDVFEEDLATMDDPYANFGVTHGAELFKNAELRPDPDICYVRNEKLTTDFEISRIHGSYAKLVRGETSLGETNT